MIKLINKDIEIYNLTLLSIKEYKKYKFLIPLVKNSWWWWLRDTDLSWRRDVFCVDGDGNLRYDYCANTNGIRPFCTLEISNPTDITIGDKVDFGGYTWTVLDSNGKIIKILCDEFVDNGKYHRFDDNINIWQKSELFDWLNTDFLPLLLEQAK